jgi:soluble lytic murein transglycosylase
MIANLNRRMFLKGACAASAAALAPFALSVEADAAVSVDAIRRALRGDFTEAGKLAQQSGDPAAIKLVELVYLQKHGKNVGFQRIRDFQATAPKWPLYETLHKRAEQALFQSPEPASAVISYFEDRKPMTAEGHAALARALIESGRAKEGRAALRDAWSTTGMDGDVEKRIASEFSGLLSHSDHEHRLARLILAQEPNAALRHARRLGSDHLRIAQVGQALIQGAGGAEKKYKALPASLRDEPALRYALARLYRKQEKFSKARGILLEAPDTASGMIDPSAWWQERRIICRRSIGPNHRDTWKAGYQLAARHGLSSGEDFVDAEFLAGWIALRYLKDAERAAAHFTQVRDGAQNRTEKARGLYWLGRAQAALGDKSSANASYKAAARHSTIYYGQLAREQIGLGKVPEEIAGGEASAGARAKVERDEVIRAMRLMHQASGKDNLHMFLWAIANRFKSVDEMNAAAAIVHGMGGTFLSLKLAKAASQFKVDIDSWSYPVRGLPEWKQIGKPVERALVFGLSRQESEFNPQAGSKAGAQGLMQLMPGTAKIIARQYRIPYVQAKLKGDPAYNVKLGAAHLADLVADFGGSYVLTLVAYNAGPRRAREWVEEYGDPRAAQVDPVDWVECIPFLETRQYVQKVLQNVHIYRSRLAPHTVKPMSADLKRGTPMSINVASTSTPEPAGCGGAGSSIASLITGCD